MKRFSPRPSKALLPAGLLGGAALLAVAGSIWWNAGRSLDEAGLAFDQEASLSFATRTLDAAPVARLEWLSAPSVYRDAALFENRLFVAAPTGILVFDAEGQLQRRYPTGSAIPPGEPAALATGPSTRRAGRALYAATSGEGLLIFENNGDAFSIEQIRPENPLHRDLTSLLPLETGGILLGTRQGGLLFYDGRRLRRFLSPLADVSVTALAGDLTNLWVGSLDQGLLHAQGGRVSRFGEDDGLPDRRILSLSVQGLSAFAGTALGVAEFRDGRFERTWADGVFANTLAVRDGSLTIGTLDEGWMEIRLDASRSRPRAGSGVQISVEYEPVQRLIEGPDGLHALTSRNFYGIHDGAKPLLAVPGATLADRNISALAISQTGHVWVGYFDRGLDILDASGNHAIHVEDEFLYCINRIVLDENKGLAAVATANGLAFLDMAGQTKQVLRRDDGLIADHTTDVLLRDDGFVAATPAGLTFAGRNGMHSVYAFHGLVNNHVYTLASDGPRLLAGTLGGLSVVDGGVIQASYTTANSSLPHNWITAIARVDHRWLVGTYGAGVLELDSSGVWRRMAGADGPVEINLNAMQATDTRVYAGTLDRGLWVYERATDRWWTFTDGLPSRNMTAVAAAGGWLYLGTDNGLVRIQERDLEQP